MPHVMKVNLGKTLLKQNINMTSRKCIPWKTIYQILCIVMSRILFTLYIHFSQNTAEIKNAQRQKMHFTVIISIAHEFFYVGAYMASRIYTT